MAIETTRFDASEYLDSDEVIAAYISEAFETNDPGLIAAAIGDIARARGMTAIAAAAGVSRQALYRGLSRDGNPELATLLRVLQAFGVQLAAVPARAPATKKKRSKPGRSAGRRPRQRAKAAA